MSRSVTLGWLAAVALGVPPPPALANVAAQTLPTSYTVLVGFPLGEAAASAGVLLVPGTVIPVDAAEPAPDLTEPSQVVLESLAFARVVDKLWRTFRLDPERKAQQGRYLNAVVSEGADLPSPPEAEARLTGELLGFSESVATYRVVFRQGAQVLADSTVNVNRGGRAVVGGMDAGSTRYIFVVVEPDPPRSRPVPFDARAGLTEPVLEQKVFPVYPKAAKEAGIQGIVLLSTSLDTQGKPGDVRVLSSPDPALSEAALQAVRHWRWSPARTRDGRPIAVTFTLTLNFRLQ